MLSESRICLNLSSNTIGEIQSHLTSMFLIVYNQSVIYSLLQNHFLGVRWINIKYSAFKYFLIQNYLVTSHMSIISYSIPRYKKNYCRFSSPKMPAPYRYLSGISSSRSLKWLRCLKRYLLSIDFDILNHAHKLYPNFLH